MYRMHRNHRIPRHWHSAHSAIWLIGLGILFFTGLWWPGILVLVGLSMILEWVFSQAAPQVFETPKAPAPFPPAAPSPAPTPAPVNPVAFTPTAPVQAVHPVQELPSACPHCGGPVRAYEVKWTGPRSAVCAYCGSGLPLKKS